MYYLLNLENLIMLAVFAAVLFIGWRAKKGDEKAQKTANVIVVTMLFVRKYFVFLFGALLFAGSWYYGKYM